MMRTVLIALILVSLSLSDLSAKIYDLHDDGRVDFDTVSNFTGFTYNSYGENTDYAFTGRQLRFYSSVSLPQGFLKSGGWARGEEAIRSRECVRTVDGVETVVSNCSYSYSVTPSSPGIYSIDYTVEFLDGTTVTASSGEVEVEKPYDYSITCDDSDGDSSKITLSRNSKTNCTLTFSSIISILQSDTLQLREQKSATRYDSDDLFPTRIIKFPAKPSQTEFPFQNGLSISFVLDSAADFLANLNSEITSNLSSINSSISYDSDNLMTLTRYLRLRLKKKSGQYDGTYSQYMNFNESVIIDTGINRSEVATTSSRGRNFSTKKTSKRVKLESGIGKQEPLLGDIPVELQTGRFMFAQNGNTSIWR